MQKLNRTSPSRHFLESSPAFYSLLMRNRPIWQLIGAILVFVPLQQYLKSPLSFFTLDSLLAVQYWLWWIIVLLGGAYALQKIGEPGRALAHALVAHNKSSASPVRRSWVPLFAGLAFLVCILTILERRQPFFFSQDDNLAQFLPVIVQGCHSLLQGVFPTWNPYQLLGAPTTTVGVYSLTYPFTYASYLLSRFFFVMNSSPSRPTVFPTLSLVISLSIGQFVAIAFAQRSPRLLHCAGCSQGGHSLQAGLGSMLVLFSFMYP